MRKLLFLLLGLSAFIGKSDAQEVGLKTNLLYLASASPNLGVEIGLGQRTTLEISAGFNPFTFSHDRKWKHWLVQPEFKWWTCERFNGHFLGVHMLGGGFDVGNLAFFPFSMWDSLKDNRYKGHAIGAGISYGYDWVLGIGISRPRLVWVMPMHGSTATTIPSTAPKWRRAPRIIGA